jgi:hypothetical protein
MKDFEAISEQGVTTAEAALYYTLFHLLTQEITLQGRLVVTAQHRVRDKRAAVLAASEDVHAAERSDREDANGRRLPASRLPGSRETARPTLKKAS